MIYFRGRIDRTWNPVDTVCWFLIILFHLCQFSSERTASYYCSHFSFILIGEIELFFLHVCWLSFCVGICHWPICNLCLKSFS